MAFIQKNEQRSYNGGYLFLQKIYHELGLDYICKKIEKKHKNKYDLSEILSMLLYTRVLYPGSKLSSLEDAKRLIEQRSADIHQVYRTLSLLATEFNEVQADVYKRSLKLGKRDTRVVYYDLTNYFFEWEEEQGLVQWSWTCQKHKHTEQYAQYHITFNREHKHTNSGNQHQPPMSDGTRGFRCKIFKMAFIALNFN